MNTLVNRILLWIFLFISLDGIIRVFEYWLNIPGLRFYKEIVFAFWIFMVVLLVLLGVRQLIFPKKITLIIFAFILIVLASIVHGLITTQLSSILIPLWGIKTSFYYILLIPVIYMERHALPQLMARMTPLIAGLTIVGCLYGLIQVVGGLELLRLLNYPPDKSVVPLISVGMTNYIRPMGFFRGAHEFAAFNLFAACIFYPLRCKRMFYYGAFLFAIIGIVISTSKVNISALPLLFIYFRWIKKNKFQQIRKAMYIFPLLAIFFLNAFPAIAIMLAVPIEILDSHDIVGSSVQRLYMWENMFTDWKENLSIGTLLLGRGYGYYGVGSKILHFVGDAMKGYEVSYSIGDNNYFMFFGNIGLIGIIIVAVLISHIVRVYEHAIEVSGTPYLKSGFVFILLLVYEAFSVNIIEAFPTQIFLFFCMVLPFCYIHGDFNAN